MLVFFMLPAFMMDPRMWTVPISVLPRMLVLVVAVAPVFAATSHVAVNRRRAVKRRIAIPRRIRICVRSFVSTRIVWSLVSPRIVTMVSLKTCRQ
jgi:hypothetical protein